MALRRFARLLLALAPLHAADRSADLVILGGSEAGFTAAIQGARMGKSVILIEPTGHPGGMLVEGIAGDVQHGNHQVISGLALETYRRLAARYGRPEPGPDQPWRPSHEPSVASEVVEAMLAEHAEHITILRRQRLKEGPAGVDKDGARLRAVILEDGTRLAGRAFIDASIEGHLLHFAGCTTVTGREGNAAFGETLNGLQPDTRHRQFTVEVDPYRAPGDPDSGLIATIQDGALGERGEPDPHVMGFCFRLCLTRDPDNRVMVDKPADYDPATYEIYRRFFAAGGDFFAPQPRLPNGKTDLGSWHDLSANLYGENASYPDGSYAEQERVVEYHEHFTRGLIWFLQHDPAVPERVRRRWHGWGLPRDEYVDHGHWPRRLYIRSARRLRSDFVHTEHHGRWKDPLPVADPVAVAWWPHDMHHAQRLVRDGRAWNEGFVFGTAGWSPFGISYRSLVPKRAEAENLITPICPSSTYVGYAAIRILPTFMMLGQAAATAAVLALDADQALQDLPYPDLHDRLRADGLTLEIPPGATWNGKPRETH